MGRSILDVNLLAKVAARKNKREQYIRERVSRFAGKRGVSSEAALVHIARQCGIGTAIYLRKLDPSKQAEVRSLRADNPAAKRPAAPAKSVVRLKRPVEISKKASLKLAANHLMRDGELRSRCLDLLGASSKFDRAINQATLVLEDRIRKKVKPATPMTGEPLVNHAFKDDLSKTVLRVASGIADDQRGFTQILRGVVPAFRNQTHHHISDDFSREEAILVVGFIDVLLRVVDRSVDVRETTAAA